MNDKDYELDDCRIDISLKRNPYDFMFSIFIALIISYISLVAGIQIERKQAIEAGVAEVKNGEFMYKKIN